jgi:hypothetical protein
MRRADFCFYRPPETTPETCAERRESLVSLIQEGV